MGGRYGGNIGRRQAPINKCPACGARWLRLHYCTTNLNPKTGNPPNPLIPDTESDN